MELCSCRKKISINKGWTTIVGAKGDQDEIDKDGQISTTHSLSAGLDYPGSSAMHGFLKDAGRARYTNASDKEALSAFKLVTQLEHIRPSLEPAHAFAECIRLAPKLKKCDFWDTKFFEKCNLTAKS